MAEVVTGKKITELEEDTTVNDNDWIPVGSEGGAALKKMRLSTLLGNVIQKYGFTKGTSGIWNYKKYNNGEYECWARADLGTLAMNKATGNVFYNSHAGLQFPVTFTSIPTVIVTIESDGGYAMSTGLRYGGATGVSTTKTGYIDVYAASSATKRVIANVFVRGMVPIVV